MEEKIYKSNKISLELIKQLKDAEVEIDCLKQYIMDLKARVAVYIPVQDDPVDKRLAEFINNYPEKKKLRLMFLREQQGLYLFGSRKVTIKLENKQLKVKVAGGFLSMDEFIDQYHSQEVDRMDRIANNSLTRKIGKND